MGGYLSVGSRDVRFRARDSAVHSTESNETKKWLDPGTYPSFIGQVNLIANVIVQTDAAEPYFRNTQRFLTIVSRQIHSHHLAALVLKKLLADDPQTLIKSWSLQEQLRAVEAAIWCDYGFSRTSNVTLIRTPARLKEAARHFDDYATAEWGAE